MPKKTVHNTYFNLIAELHRIADFQLADNSSTTPLFLPDQQKLENWIYEKYLTYNRTFSPLDILYSVQRQLAKHSQITGTLHPDWQKPIIKIMGELFPHLIPNALKLARPSRKWCPQCKVIKSTADCFIPVSRNVDRFSKLCQKCEAFRERKPRSTAQSRELLSDLGISQFDNPPPTNPIPDDLDNIDDLIDNHSNLIGDL